MFAGENVDRQHGVLADWRDDRGFGFITPNGGGSRVFVHISAFPRGRRPTAGTEVTYVQVRDERDRPRAAQVHYAGATVSRPGMSRVLRVLVGIALFFALLTCLVVWRDLPVTVVAVYVLLSALTFVLYGADKAAARHGERRTSESTLHTLALAGGWPGALVARPVFRHKTTKQPFRTVFWGTVVANCSALAWLTYAEPLTLP